MPSDDTENESEEQLICQKHSSLCIRRAKCNPKSCPPPPGTEVVPAVVTSSTELWGTQAAGRTFGVPILGSQPLSPTLFYQTGTFQHQNGQSQLKFLLRKNSHGIKCHQTVAQVQHLIEQKMYPCESPARSPAVISHPHTSLPVKSQPALNICWF